MPALLLAAWLPAAAQPASAETAPAQAPPQALATTLPSLDQIPVKEPGPPQEPQRVR